MKTFFIQMLLIVALPALANTDSTLTVNVINHSSKVFEFDHASVQFSGNTLAIDRTKLAPGETAIITGTTTSSFDLSGIVHFKGGAQFWIVVRRQFHFGQPVLSMHDHATRSSITERTMNPQIGPKLLSYTAATVLVTDAALHAIHTRDAAE